MLFSLLIAAALSGPVVEPPNDGRSYATIVFTTCPPTTADKQLLAALDTDAALKSLNDTTHVFRFCQTDPLWKDRFAESHDGTSPAIWIQDYSGAVLFKRSGAACNPATLAAEIADTFAGIRESLPPSEDVGRKPFFIPDSIKIGPTISPSLHLFNNVSGDEFLTYGLIFVAAYLFFRRDPQ